MKTNLTTHRVVTFLTRDELEFLDKLEKDMMFSTGKHISRSQIIEDLAGFLANSDMDAIGIKTNEELKKRILEALAEEIKKLQNKE